MDMKGGGESDGMKGRGKIVESWNELDELGKAMQDGVGLVLIDDSHQGFDGLMSHFETRFYLGITLCAVRCVCGLFPGLHVRSQGVKVISTM